MLALESDTIPLLMRLNKDQLYALLVSIFLSKQEWLNLYQASPAKPNKIIIEEYLQRFNPKRYADLINIFDYYIPNLIQARLESTILSRNNNLELHSDDLWMVCIQVFMQAGQSWDEINRIIAKINYQSLPLYIGKYIAVPADACKSIQYAIKQKLKNIRLDSSKRAELPTKICYYPKSIYKSLLNKGNSVLIRSMCKDISNIIMLDQRSGSQLYLGKLAEHDSDDMFMEPILRLVFDIINLSALMFIENEIDPINIIHQKNLQLAFEKLGGVYHRQQHTNQFGVLDPQMLQDNLSISIATSVEDNQSLANIDSTLNLINQEPKSGIFKKENLHKALIGSAALGLTYLLFNKKDPDADDSEE